MSDPQNSDLVRQLAAVRPRLHRYCARMMGSAFDGEDVVQEAMARALQAWHPGVESLENWLFRIAHNAALDALRRRRREAARRSDHDLEAIGDDTNAGDRRVAARAALAVFMALPAAQRSAVVLADVLEYSLAETAAILDVTLPALKASLHRGRLALREIAGETTAPVLDAAELVRLRAYADRFNARDFDALRNLLAEDAKLDLVSRTRLAGAKEVGTYFTRYSGVDDWRFSVRIAEGRPVLFVARDAKDGGDYVVLVGWRDDRLLTIRDFRYAPYVMDGLELGDPQ